MNKGSVAFLSYVQFDDQHEDGNITKLREALSREVRVQTGEDFPIFQDKKDIQWGQQWEERITQSIDSTTFLIPILTPLYFNRPACRQELSLFLEREKQLGRHDLILPIYYVDCDCLQQAELKEKDPLAKEIASRQYDDWRQLRFESLESNLVRKKISELASQIKAAKQRVPAASPITVQVHAHTKENELNRNTNTEIQKGLADSSAKSKGKSSYTVHTVDPLHRGDFTKIGDAVAAANPGDVIHIMPGLYVESIRLDKPLELIGKGPREEIVIQSNDQSALKFDSSFGLVSNVTLRQKAGDKVFCVAIQQGRLRLEDCDISSQVISAIGVYNEADPRIRNNRIHSSKESGVYFYDSSTGSLEDNHITGNTIHGVAVSGKANPTIRRNVIQGNDAGISVYNGAGGRIENNDVNANRIGIIVWKKGQPIVSENKIFHNLQSGVFVYDDGAGIFEKNNIAHSGYSGIEIKRTSKPIFRENDLHHNKESGMFIHSDSAGTFNGNRVYENGYHGAEIKNAASPVLRNNKLSNNGRHGILAKGGTATIENNEILQNQGVGFIAIDKAEVKVTNNEIKNCAQGGVWLKSETNVTMSGNTIEDNLGFNFKKEPGVVAELNNNRIAEMQNN